MRDTEWERGKDTGRGGSRLHAGSWTWNSILVSRITAWAEGGAKQLSHLVCPTYSISFSIWAVLIYQVYRTFLCHFHLSLIWCNWIKKLLYSVFIGTPGWLSRWAITSAQDMISSLEIESWSRIPTMIAFFLIYLFHSAEYSPDPFISSKWQVYFVSTHKK